MVMQHLFGDFCENESFAGSPSNEPHLTEGITQLISNDLGFLVPLLRKFPKCYWIWNYRLWLLEEASRLLPRDDSVQFWLQELHLVGKMLNLDSRNFHGWGYRRMVVEALESTQKTTEEAPQSMAEQEFQYTTRMVETNLSNFSAWHNRSKLIPNLLNEQGADGMARKKTLDTGTVTAVLASFQC
jgi:geranylgeranyl transferase type-2 subunit alpha